MTDGIEHLVLISACFTDSAATSQLPRQPGPYALTVGQSFALVRDAIDLGGLQDHQRFPIHRRLLIEPSHTAHSVSRMIDDTTVEVAVSVDCWRLAWHIAFVDGPAIIALQQELEAPS